MIFESDVDLFFLYGRSGLIPNDNELVCGKKLNRVQSEGFSDMGTEVDSGVMLSVLEVNALGGDENHKVEKQVRLQCEYEYDGSQAIAAFVEVYIMNAFTGETPLEKKFKEALSAYDVLLSGGQVSGSLGGRSFSNYTPADLKETIGELRSAAANERHRVAGNFNKTRPFIVELP
jgi:hypothetical protein